MTIPRHIEVAGWSRQPIAVWRSRHRFGGCQIKGEAAARLLTQARYLTGLYSHPRRPRFVPSGCGWDMDAFPRYPFLWCAAVNRPPDAPVLTKGPNQEIVGDEIQMGYLCRRRESRISIQSEPLSR